MTRTTPPAYHGPRVVLRSRHAEVGRSAAGPARIAVARARADATLDRIDSAVDEMLDAIRSRTNPEGEPR